MKTAPNHLRALAKAAVSLAAAIEASSKAADRRKDLGTDCTRARMTTANARWMTLAEDRDRKQAAFDEAMLEAFPWLDGAAVAELIEADREYDAVKAEHDACSKYDEHGAYVPREMYERMEAVSARRAAAMARYARVGGA